MSSIGQGKNKKASDISRGFWFSALYSSCLKANTKNWDHTQNFCHSRAGSLQDPEDVGRKEGAGATGRAPGSCAASSEGPLHL